MSKQEEQLWVDFLQAIRDDDEDQVKKILSTGGGKSQFLSRKTSTTQGSLTALHLAVKHGNENIIKLLLERGADVNAIGHHGCTALHIAVDRVDKRIIQLLLSQKDIDVDTTDEYGYTAIMLAADRGNSQTVEMLIEKGADMTKADSVDNTAIHAAADKGHYEVLEMLLAKAVTQNPGIIGKQNKDRNTPLHLAVSRGCQNSVALLLRYGAASSLELENRLCETPKKLAAGNKAILELLENPAKAFQTRPVEKVIGRGGSVEADRGHYPVAEQIPLATNALLATGFSQGTVMYVTTPQVAIHNEFKTKVSYVGCAAIGPWSELHTGQAPVMPRVRPQPPSTAESSYKVIVSGGNVSIGDHSVTNVGTSVLQRTSLATTTTEPEHPEHRDSGLLQTLPDSTSKGSGSRNCTEEESTPGKLPCASSSDVDSLQSPADMARVPSTPAISSYPAPSGWSVVNPVLLQERIKAAEKSGMLDFSHVGLSMLSPKLLHSVNHHFLTKLDLSHNALTDLSDLIGDLINLTHLFANDNQLSLLPKTIKQLQQLQELDLRNNKLKSVFKDTTDLKRLKRLSVEGNPLTLEEVRSLMELVERRLGLLVDIAELETSTVSSEEDFTDDVSRAPSRLTAEHKLKILVTTTVEFEAKHKECVRVLPYSDGGDAKVQFYVFSGKSGIPQKLKLAAQECFKQMEVKLEWLDLYNDSTKILNVTPVEFSSGKPKRLSESQVNEINEIISKNLQVLVPHRNITAVQASFKITKSKQTNRPCIAIYVLRKGFIPDGEVAFPPTLGAYPVDVVDGFWFRTDDPWTPNKAQEQSEVLCLGSSIGVKGEEESGTLGAIVEEGGNWFALSCDHVMKHHAETQIIHPGLNDYLNYLNYHLQQYGIRIKNTMNPATRYTLEPQFSFGNLTGSEELLAKFQELKAIRESSSDPSRVTERKLQAVNLHEKAFVRGLTPPRVIGKYIAGVSRNVTWTDDQEYYIDAALALLTPEEVNSLRQSQTAEIIGTGDSPSGKCSSSVSASRELCKSGRTTEFTNSGRHVDPSIFLNSSLYEVNAQNKRLVSVLKRVKLCQSCAERSGLRENRESTLPPCESFTKDTTALCDSLWFKNCLCIDHADDIERGKVFAAKGDSGAILFERDADESLSGFGIIFGELRHSHKLCTLASPLQIALETLSKEISENSSLRLLSDYDCKFGTGNDMKDVESCDKQCKII